VKSCRGIAVDRAIVEPWGLRHDRRWMIVDASDAFVTQRQEPRLALIETALEADTVVLSARGHGGIRLPLAPRSGARRRVRVWRDEVNAIDGGDEGARWLGEVLGAPVRLVFMPEADTRQVNPKYGRHDDRVSFADAYPVLVATNASLADLDARLDAPLPMDRFRPNVVLAGCTAWEEDGWTRVRIGDVPMRVVKGCDRCVVTTTDQRTGERGVEPLRTLATFRKRDNLVYFAVNAVPDATGELRVGDAVDVFA
jgi:uncharacterized protein YcbX